MKPYPAPKKEGFFWAKLIHPTRMPVGEDWASADWEVVDVFDNNDDTFRVHVPGIEPSQNAEDFVWGPEVIRPEELKK